MATPNNNSNGNKDQKGQVLVVKPGGMAVEKPEVKDEKPEIKPDEKPEEKPELSKLAVAAKPQPPAETVKKVLPTIAERLKKLEEFNELVERRETLTDAIDKLKAFYISETGTCNVKLQDSKGNTFGISHPIVIGEMVHMATEKLIAELQEVEDKINFTF